MLEPGPPALVSGTRSGDLGAGDVEIPSFCDGCGGGAIPGGPLNMSLVVAVATGKADSAFGSSPGVTLGAVPLIDWPGISPDVGGTVWLVAVAGVMEG